MSRLWWATIAGLVLGAVLFGMMQRGCDATGAHDETRLEDASGRPQPEAHDFTAGAGALRRPNSSAPTGPNAPMIGSRAGSSQDAFRRDNPSRATRSPSTPYTRPVRTPPPGARAALDRPIRPGAATSRTNTFNGRQANRPSRATPPDARSLLSSPSARRSTGGAPGRVQSPGGLVTDADVERAREDFQAQLAEANAGETPRGRRNGDDASSSDSALATDAETRADSDSSTPSRSEDGLGQSQGPGRSRSETHVGSGPQSRPPGQFGGALVTTGSGIPRTTPTDNGGGDTGGGNTGGGNTGGGNTGGGNTGGGNSGGGSTGGGPPPVVSPAAVVAKWIEAPAASSCGDLRNFRTNDLYLGFSNPALVLVMTSDPAFGLRVFGGNVYQDTSPFGSNAPPDAGAISLSPCLASDSYLTLGGLEPVFAPGLEPNKNGWGESLNATWFAIPGAPAIQNRARFGDDRYYVQVARITAGGPSVNVSGALLVSYIDLLAGSNKAELVPLLPCTTCWTGASGAVTPADIASVSFATPSVAGGLTANGTVTLAKPAPITGATINLSSANPAVATVPTSVIVPAGETTATFTVSTTSVEALTTVAITANDGRKSVSAPLAVQPLSVASITFSPSVIPGGAVAKGTITLNVPAGPAGIIVTIQTHPPELAPFPTRAVLVRPGQTTAAFEITPVRVPRETTIYVFGVIGGDGARGAFGQFTVRPVFGDLNGDGVVNASDQALVLGAWGPCPPSGACEADLNGDGVINSKDLALLLGAWTTTGSGPGGPDPGAGPAVVARWVPVEITTGCSQISDGFRSADLYLGFNAQHRVTLVESNSTSGIRIQNGVFFQAQGGGNRPVSPELFENFPCLEFDSYMTLEGQTAPFLNFTPDTNALPNNWGSVLQAGWFVTSSPPGVAGVRDVPRFGDDRYYVRIGRFTAQDAASISGAVTAFYVDASSGQSLGPVITVPDWSNARASLDLNGDGHVNADDISMMTRAMGATSGPADLNGDGLVNSLDLRLILEAVADLPN